MNINRNNLRKQAIYLSLFVIFMVLLSYASVPLYKLFCQVTGYGGTPKISEVKNFVYQKDEIKVRFDSSIEKNSPLFFEPVLKKITTKVGQNNLIFFKAVNNSKKTIKATATFNVTPLRGAQFFNKIECFCFEEQIFEPGQVVEMPVSFFVDPEIVKNKNTNSIDELTLSYTMFIKK